MPWWENETVDLGEGLRTARRISPASPNFQMARGSRLDFYLVKIRLCVISHRLSKYEEFYRAPCIINTFSLLFVIKLILGVSQKILWHIVNHPENYCKQFL